MTDAQTILKMIEEVDPADTAKLDEIDARVACYLNNTFTQKFIRMINRCGRFGDGFEFEYWSDIDGKDHGIRNQNLGRRFTRSRDALKAIRPEGWYFSINGVINERKTFNATAYKPHPERIGKTYPNLAAWGRAEELAELHAIIQAIDYERGRG